MPLPVVIKELLPLMSDAAQSMFDARIDRAFGGRSVRLAFPLRRNSTERSDGCVDGTNYVDVKTPIGNGLDDVLAKHEIAVRVRSYKRGGDIVLLSVHWGGNCG